jgi:predicted secreted hydrolase
MAVAAMPATRLDLLRNDSSSQGFARASQLRDFEFPRDHGPHPDFRHEWWYVTGQLESADCGRFGFELTFFRYALTLPGELTRSTGASAWRADQIYLAHFAITDLKRREFYSTQRYARAALGLAGARSNPLRVWLENWQLELSASTGSLRAASERYQISLNLQPLLEPVLNGEQGLSRKSSNAASYYYSMPRIAVKGHLTRESDQPVEVSGLAWLDREWGSGALGADQQGWDWFALQLDDGSSLMFYSLRRHDGKRDPHSAGTWVMADGHSRAMTSEEVQLEVINRWTSPRGGTYPAGWRLRAPAIALDVTIQPLLADQELAAASPRYWEGAVSVEGRRGERKSTGRGYVELVGYARAPDGATMPAKARNQRHDKGRGREYQ